MGPDQGHLAFHDGGNFLLEHDIKFTKLCCRNNLLLFYAYLKYESSSIPSNSLTISALGLLLVFRTNSAYHRFAEEGRKIGEEILSVVRDLICRGWGNYTRRR